jgi:hypothetical protein
MRRTHIAVLSGIGMLVAAQAFAQPAEPPEPEPVATPELHRVEIHGFVSEGAFVSTANDYIGVSSRGSVKLLEVGINFSTEVADRLRAGVQVFARELGKFEDSPHFDWAYLDYRWRPWLGLRAGIVKMPFGLYNEYTDIDSARVPILMPQGVYPIRNRDVLLAHRGFSVYGNVELGSGGELEYQTWLGTLSIPENALELSGATLDGIDTKYVTGAHVFWSPPVEGLRIGGTWLRASIDFNLTLSPENVQFLIDAGVVPADFDGKLLISQRPDTWLIGSVEYLHEAWLFALEYARAFKHQQTSLPAVLPTFDEDSERFYGLATYRLSPSFEVGGYYSVLHADAGDRQGRNEETFPQRIRAFQRDLAATLRYDVNDHWLWKLEAHFIDGAADLIATDNPDPERYWGLFLLRTTLTF